MIASLIEEENPTPAVPVFDAATVSVDEVVQGLIRAGGVVLRNAMSAEDLATIESDTRSYIDADAPWVGSFFPPETRRVHGLAGKSKTFMKTLVRHRLYQGASAALLTSTQKQWVGDQFRTSVSPPQLNNTIIFSIGPGARAQELHRDDAIHHHVCERMRPEDYVIGQDLGIGFFVAAKRTTKANGATRFIPGSHLWSRDTPPSEDLAFYAELEPGDGFIMMSSCYHGGSANTTKDEERLVYSSFMTKGFLRQEENQYISNSPETLKEMYADDLDMLKLIGYDISPPFLGWVDGSHPLKTLYKDYKANDDLY